MKFTKIDFADNKVLPIFKNPYKIKRQYVKVLKVTSGSIIPLNQCCI
jgi:hypothetical protein